MNAAGENGRNIVLWALLLLGLAACHPLDGSGCSSRRNCPPGCRAVDQIFDQVEKVDRVALGTPPDEEAPPPTDTSVTLCRYIDEMLRQQGCSFDFNTPVPPNHCKSTFTRLSRRMLSSFPMNPSTTCARASFPPIRRHQAIQSLAIEGGTLLKEDLTFAPNACPANRRCQSLPLDAIFSRNLTSMTARLPGFLQAQPQIVAGQKRWFLVGEIPVVTVPRRISVELIAENARGIAVAKFDIIVGP